MTPATWTNRIVLLYSDGSTTDQTVEVTEPTGLRGAYPNQFYREMREAKVAIRICEEDDALLVLKDKTGTYTLGSLLTDVSLEETLAALKERLKS